MLGFKVESRLIMMNMELLGLLGVERFVISFSQ